MAIRLVNSKAESRILPVTFTLPDIPLQQSWPTETLAGRDGVVSVGRPSYSPRRLQIRGTLFDPDPTKIPSARDGLLAYLQHAPLDLYRHDQDSRYIRVRPTNIEQQWLQVNRELQIRIDLEALDPYWYYKTAQVLDWDIDTPDSVTVENKGTVPVSPVVMLTGMTDGEKHTTDPKITNETTGQVIEFKGELAGGEELRIDTYRFTASLDGNNVLGFLGEGFLINGFELVPGENALKVEQDTTDGSGKVRLDLTFRERWL